MPHEAPARWAGPSAVALLGSLCVIGSSMLAAPQPGVPALALLSDKAGGIASLLGADPDLRILGFTFGGHALVVDFKRADLATTSLSGVAVMLSAPTLGGICHIETSKQGLLF